MVLLFPKILFLVAFRSSRSCSALPAPNQWLSSSLSTHQHRTALGGSKQEMAVISPKMSELTLKEGEGDCSMRGLLMCENEDLKRNPSETLNHQRKQNDQMCDVVIICGTNEHNIYAHRAILALAIPSLEKIIEIENGISCVSLPDLEPFAVDALVEFIYTSKLELTPDRVWDVLSAAHKVELRDIVDKCQHYIQEHMLSKCWLYARQISLERDYTWLLSAVDNYIAEHFQDISRSSEFLQLPRLQVELINKRDDAMEEKGRGEEASELLGLVVKWCEERLEVSLD